MDRLTRVVSYVAVFLVGYYLGGGCEKREDTRVSPTSNRRVTIMEKQMEQYQDRIEELERRLEDVRTADDYIERREYWGKQS